MSHLNPLVLSGIQPTGSLHLGNYLGAIQKFVHLQTTYTCFYCVVDLHSLTTELVHENLEDQTRSIAAALLASGIDAQKSVIFNQSRVSQHAELAWIFNCVARLGWMTRMTQFKDKAGVDRENASLGLLAYPSLMAADILLYRATHVPVGDDQKQHLELTRDIAQKFNHDFAQRIEHLGKAVSLKNDDKKAKGYFPIVEPIIEGLGARVMSLRDATKKMSKSDPSEMSRINLTDDPDTISKKIKKAKTDSDALSSEISNLENRLEVNNLVNIYSALRKTSKQSVLDEFGGKSFSIFKTALIDILVDKIVPIGKKMVVIYNDKNYVDAILREGAKSAGVVAKTTIKDVYSILGLNQS